MQAEHRESQTSDDSATAALAADPRAQEHYITFLETFTQPDPEHAHIARPRRERRSERWRKDGRRRKTIRSSNAHGDTRVFVRVLW